jgi:2-phospho-L-lactate/phosphoenolpyruvate guanylyltransferase
MSFSRPWLLVPVRSFASGKRRLAPVLDAASRHAHGMAMLDHVLAQAAVWPGLDRTVVLSPCTEVLCHARAAGARALRQPALPRLEEASSAALNAALSHARRELAHWGRAPLLVVSSDLPWLQSTDLQHMARCSRQGRRVVVAADHAGQGTNALFLPTGAALPFRFGQDSLRRHGAAARALGRPVARVDIAGLAFDVDTPADLQRLQLGKRNFA